MASAPVDIPVKVRGLNNLQKLEKKFEQLEKDVAKLNTQLPKATNNVRAFGDAGRGAARGMQALNKAAFKVAAVIATIKSAGFLFTATADIESQTKSLEVLTGSLQQTKQIIGELQDFSTITPFTGSELIETGKRLKAFGVETEKLVDTTKRLADVSGATGARLGEVATAYGQIQAKGRLQGEELLQLQERGIALQDELQRMYGLSGQEFSKAMSQGRIGAESVEQAIINLTSETGTYFNGAVAQSQTLAGKWSTLIDAVTKLAQGLGQTLGPAFKKVLDFATAVTNEIIRMIEFVNKLLGIGTENAIAKLEREIASLQGRLGTNNGRRDDQYARDIAAKQKQIQLLKQEQVLTEKIKTPTPAGPGPVPELLGGTAAGSSSSKASTKITDPLKEQNRLLDKALAKTLEQTAAFQDQMRSLDDQKAILEGKLNGTEREARLAIQIRDATKGLAPEYAAIVEERIRGINAMELELQQQNEINKGVEEMQSQYESLANGIAGSMTDAFTSIIDGSKSAEEAFSDMLKSMGKMFIDFAMKIVQDALTQQLMGIFGSMFGSLGGAGGGMGSFMPLGAGFAFADGGYVDGPTNATIGEGGEPEYVIPQSKMGDAMGRYSRGQRGAGVIEGAKDSGGDPQEQALEPTSMAFNFNTIKIADEDYVSTGQLQAAMATAASEGAKAGEAQTLRRLRMNPSTRRQVGI